MPAPDRGCVAAADRLDVALVRRGLARSRGEARDLVAAGHVVVDGVAADRPSLPVTAATPLAVTRQDRWVSRGGDKLVAALDRFGVSGLGRRCIDVGASTGGFTQVLLARGALVVVALDVGHGQLHPTLAADPRVDAREGTSIRDVAPADLGGPAGLVVVDLSFISVRLVLAKVVDLLAASGDLVVLVKPQFEVGRHRLGKHGLVRKVNDRRDALESVVRAAAEHGLVVAGVAPSPVRGSAGNAEYLLWCRRSGFGLDRDELAVAIGQAVGVPSRGASHVRTAPVEPASDQT
ncbi:MAG TPA: TlyA family RNA methyltransferase [Dermatophilaceae bacterium]|nr:TlyA family RNA methyltransferase [Dermatophilaceae bacterium]